MARSLFLLTAAAAVLAFVTSCVGPTRRAVDPSTLTGKVMCGYQGWFNAEGDGAGRGYTHWTRGNVRPTPASVRVDLWPDLGELGPDERFPTDLLHADGRRAEVFSSFRRATVVRHFRWMEEHGIDGVFLQRFVNSLARPGTLAHNNTVLEHCRAGAREHGRVYAMMYDLSGLAPGQADRLIEDWKTLVRETGLTRDPQYLRHRGKPLLALWGCGFKDEDKPRPGLDDWRKILHFLKNDPAAGGVAIMLGVPSYWREQRRDSITDPTLHAVLQMADVISPWTPGRYRTPEAAARHAVEVWQPDLAWCRERQLDFLPVAFPGFSWHNMKGAPLADIPRLGGRFFWSQIAAAKRAGAEMLYVAMFDEVDEGTAIFKCTNEPPTANGAKFVTYEGLPADHYLRLTGLAGKVIRGELPPEDAPPLGAAGAPAPAAAEPQIRERLAAIRAAILARQPEGIVRWGTDDWTMVDAAGQSFDRAAYLVRVRGLFERLEAIESLDTRIERVVATGDKAAVELTQTMVRREREPAGKVARVRVRYREAQDWVRVAGEWRVRQVRFIGAQERTELDAKPEAGGLARRREAGR